MNHEQLARYDQPQGTRAKLRIRQAQIERLEQYERQSPGMLTARAREFLMTVNMQLVAGVVAGSVTLGSFAVHTVNDVANHLATKVTLNAQQPPANSIKLEDYARDPVGVFQDENGITYILQAPENQRPGNWFISEPGKPTRAIPANQVPEAAVLRPTNRLLALMADPERRINKVRNSELSPRSKGLGL